MHAYRRNSVARLLAQAAGKLALFLWTLVLAQKLSPSGYGLYAWILSLVTVLGIVSDYGLGYLATGDVARRPETAGRYLAHTLALRMLLAVAAFSVLALLVVTQPPLRLVAGPALLLGLSIFTLSAINGGNAILNAREELHWSSLFSGLIPMLTLGVGWWLLALHPSLVSATLPSPLAGGLVVLAALLLFRRKGIRAEGPVRSTELLRILGAGWPFLLLSLLATLNVALDLLLIKPLSGEAAAGIYSASQKLMLALMILPAALCDAAYPVWSRESARPGRSSLPPRRILGVLSLAAVAAAAFLYLAAGPLIRRLYGPAYAEAAPVLRVHAITLAWMFLNAPLATRLLAFGRLRDLNLAQAAVVLLHAALVLFLLPKRGIVGAGIATAVSEFVSLLLLGWLVTRAGRIADGAIQGSR